MSGRQREPAMRIERDAGDAAQPDALVVADDDELVKLRDEIEANFKIVSPVEFALKAEMRGGVERRHLDGSDRWHAVLDGVADEGALVGAATLHGHQQRQRGLALAQVVADRLGIPMEDISIEHGDTGKVLFGMGTYGSRSLAVGGTAIVKAVDKIVAKGKRSIEGRLRALGMRLIARDSMSTGLVVGSLVFGFLLAIVNCWQLVRQRRRMQLPEWTIILSCTESKRQEAEQGRGANALPRAAHD